jgi:sugar lactone lactonase YvrE
LWWSGSLKKPVDAVFAGNRVFVPDQVAQNVYGFLANGVLANSFGVSNSNSIALGPDGNLYVGTSGVTIQVFSSLGIPVTSWQSGTTTPGKTALDSWGNIYVPDMAGNQVLIYQPISSGTGQLAGVLGQSGNGPGQFSSPSAVAIDGTGNIYVAEQGANQRISVFDPGGTFLRMWGGMGRLNGLFNNISDIKIAPNGLVWAVDSGNDRIQVFDPYGNYLQAFGSSGAEEGEFFTPNGLAFDPSGGIYVADTGNGRIQHWESCAAIPTSTPTPISAAPTYHLWLDAGSSKLYVDQAGNPWLADQAFQTGGFGYVQGGTAVSQSASVTGTLDPLLYQAYRAGSALSYEVAVPPGTYSVTLLSADFTSTGKGQNVFNVLAQGQAALSNVDIYAAVGPDAALAQNFPVTVAPGAALTLVWNAASGEAFVSAIAVVGSQPNPSPPLIYIRKPGWGALAH